MPDDRPNRFSPYRIAPGRRVAQLYRAPIPATERTPGDRAGRTAATDLVAGLAMTIAAVTSILGGIFALAALVRGLEQVLPTWAAYAVTSVLLLTCAAIGIAICVWLLARAMSAVRS
ncbi:hypothetical protein ASD42_01810 [Nocardia sp. Root136]|nr:hypothetical protein ASD42_01810 [Nocardia sp. Root136]